MKNPFTALVTLQVSALNQFLTFTRNVLNFYLSLQPTAMQPIPISKSTSLVPLNHPANRRAR